MRPARRVHAWLGPRLSEELEGRSGLAPGPRCPPRKVRSRRSPGGRIPGCHGIRVLQITGTRPGAAGPGHASASAGPARVEPYPCRSHRTELERPAAAVSGAERLKLAERLDGPPPRPTCSDCSESLFLSGLPGRLGVRPAAAHLRDRNLIQ